MKIFRSWLQNCLLHSVTLLSRYGSVQSLATHMHCVYGGMHVRRPFLCIACMGVGRLLYMQCVCGVWVEWVGMCVGCGCGSVCVCEGQALYLCLWVVDCRFPERHSRGEHALLFVQEVVLFCSETIDKYL